MLSIANFFISFILFFFACLFCLYLPGFWFFKKLRLKCQGLEVISLSLSLGIVSFVFLSLVLGFLRLRFLLLPLTLFLGAKVIFSHRQEALDAFKARTWSLKNKKAFLFVLLLGFLAQIWINIFSGWRYSDGIRFHSSHGHDAPWHGSVVQEIATRFPPRMRFVGNLPLKNYHFFVDILFGEFYRLFRFNPLDLYFRHFTFLFAALFLLNIFVFVRNWHDEKAALWATHLTIFAGSFGYLITLIRNQTLLGLRSEAIFWVSQGNTAIGNPPQIVAFILFLAFLNLFYHWQKKPSLTFLVVLGLFGGLIFGFKVYSGATILGGLGLLAGYELVFRKKVKNLLLFLAVLAPALLVFFSTTEKGGSFLVFEPLWFVRTMVVAGDRLGWMDLELRRQFYLAQGGLRGYLRVFQFESFALLIFIFGNLGIKFLGFGEVFKNLCGRRKIKPLDLFLVFTLLVCFLVPQVFVQKAIAWNTVQFLHYFVLLMGLFSGVVVSRLASQPKSLKKGLSILLIVVLGLPTVLADLKFFAPGNALAIVENQELEAIRALQKATDPEEPILTHPYNRWAAASHPIQPRPIYSWDSTGYLSYFSNRPTFMSDQGQVEIMGYKEGKKRTEALYEYLFFSGSGADVPKNPGKARQFLIENNLKYIYLVYKQKFAFDPEEAGLELIFQNPVARIYKLAP
jgi:hypothetical protein